MKLFSGSTDIYCILFLTFLFFLPFPAMLLTNRSCTQETEGFQRNSNERQTQNVDLNQNRMSGGNIKHLLATLNM